LIPAANRSGERLELNAQHLVEVKAHGGLGIVQKLFPIFLEAEVRNIRVRNITHPAPLLE
jgi:hypothetical protein